MLKRILQIPTRTLLLIALAAGLVLTVNIPGRGSLLYDLVAWFLLCTAIERLWHLARDGRTRLGVLSAAHVPALVFLPGLLGPAVTTVAALTGAYIFRRRPGVGPWQHAGVVLAASVSAAAILTLAEPEAHHSINLIRLLPLAAAAVVYVGVTQAMITRLYLPGGTLSFVDAWQLNHGHPVERVTGIALVLVSLLGILCYSAFGLGGLALCVMPLMFVRDGSRRFLDLDRAQRSIVEAERLAAKGEMAGEVGHEINNYLAAISGRAQLMAMDPVTMEDPDLADDLESVRSAAMSMGELSRGLMDLAQREAKSVRFLVNDVVEQTLELVRLQPRFSSLQVQVDPAPTPAVVMDPGQLQQLIMSVLARGARLEGVNPRLRLVTRFDEPTREIRIEVFPAGTTAGDITERFPNRVDTTRTNRELASVRRILERNRGHLKAQADDDAHEAYRLVLPAA